jgi:hypothetical protein
LLLNEAQALVANKKRSFQNKKPATLSLLEWVAGLFSIDRISQCYF